MMEWQFWAQLGTFAATVLVSTWYARGWLGKQFDSVRENAHKILEKHEEKDERRHQENVSRLNDLEREHSLRMTALEVQLARINRGGRRAGPEYTAP